MGIGFLHGLWTFLILVIFILIVAYVWSGKRRKHFEDAGRIPFDDDEEANDHKAGKDQT